MLQSIYLLGARAGWCIYPPVSENIDWDEGCSQWSVSCLVFLACPSFLPFQDSKIPAKKKKKPLGIHMCTTWKWGRGSTLKGLVWVWALTTSATDNKTHLIFPSWLESPLIIQSYIWGNKIYNGMQRTPKWKFYSTKVYNYVYRIKYLISGIQQVVLIFRW